jgi:hypothetical protein
MVDCLSKHSDSASAEPRLVGLPLEDCKGRRLGSKWAPVGSVAWAHEVPTLPPELSLEPWAAPKAADWCPSSGRPRIFVILTASVHAFVNLARRGMKGQQRNTTERRGLYEQVVRRWATESNVTVIFAENSGADLTSIEQQVPSWRRPSFELLHIQQVPERLPFRGRPDVGRLEARSIVAALNTSRLLARRCPSDVVFGVTGRYFVHGFERLVARKCFKGRGGRFGQPPLPLVYVQHPEWWGNSNERHRYERETSVLGFAASYAVEVHGWAMAPAGDTYENYIHYGIGSEGHLGKLVKRMEDDVTLRKLVCDLPPLPIMPVREGSTGKMRESI